VKLCDIAAERQLLQPSSVDLPAES